jgi:hypothetical protein
VLLIDLLAVRGDALARYFGSHFVPLYFDLRRGEEWKVHVWSSFPFSVAHMNIW